MSNRILLVLSFFVISFSSVLAQTKSTKDSLLEVICQCASAKKAELMNGSSKDLQKAIEMCFISNGMDLFMKYAKEQNVDLSDEDAMRKLGTSLGVELMKTCPVVAELSLDVANRSSSKKIVVDEEVGELNGIIEAVHTTTYPVSVQLKQSNGSMKKLYIISKFFTTDDKFYNMAYMIGKNVKVEFSNQKIFIPTSKKFEEIDVINSLNHP